MKIFVRTHWFVFSVYNYDSSRFITYWFAALFKFAMVYHSREGTLLQSYRVPHNKTKQRDLQREVTFYYYFLEYSQ